MRAERALLRITASIVFLLAGPLLLTGQVAGKLTLEKAMSLATENNHLLNVRKLQVEEKQQKVIEDRIKYLPTLALGASYQYNSTLPSITIEQGRFGQLPFGTVIIPLPSVDEVIEVGKHNIYQAGVTMYQPLTQIGKINAGVSVSKTELQIAKNEEARSELQVRQGVEKLFFGLLIIQKQMEEAEIKVLMAERKLRDAETALASGKTTGSSGMGLSAAAADEQQNLLKLRILHDDYADDLRQITGLTGSEPLILEPVPSDEITGGITSVDTSLILAEKNNYDLKIASLYTTKADNSIRASRYSYLPDLGILGGYTYQEGSDIYPRNNAFVGAQMKWNIQDLLSNRTIQRQRIFAKKQAEENLVNTREQVNKDIARSYRKLKQSEELIGVAEKVVRYRREDLNTQNNKMITGLGTETDFLTAKAAMAKAESDLYAAQLNYRMALSELKILTGNY